MIEEHEDLLATAFLSFTKFERAFRFKIAEVLSKKFGSLWSLQLPTSIKENLEQKLKETSENDYGLERDKDLLNYADFSQLESIVGYYWNDIFKLLFEDKDITKEHLERVRYFRNALMHSVLVPNQCPAFISICEELIKKIEGVSKDINLVTFSKPGAKTVSSLKTPYSSSNAQKVFHQKVSSVLNQMTGLFEGERDALIGYIRKNLSLCTFILLDEIRLKFSNLSETDEIIDSLVKVIPPEKPKQPESKKLDLNKWLKWAATSYLPYRYWMMMNAQKVDDDLETMSLNYEDWLYHSYPDLINKYPERFVFGSYIQINKYLNKNKKVLWILIDNLPLFYQGELTRQLNTYGFRVVEQIRQISMLPSFTDVSRESALAGRLPNQMREDQNEKQNVYESWQKLTNKRIVWLDNLQDLENAYQHQGDLYIYVYSRLDKLWHTPENKDIAREDDIESTLANFISKLSKSFKKLVKSDPTVLVISTDHGAILLPQGCETLSIPPSAVKDAEYEEHRRFIRLSNPDALNQDEWFYLDKDVYHLHQNYAITRGWRSIGEQRKSFTHGGLSPEETIVPLLICELEENEFERILPIYEQASEPMRPGKASNLVIRVRNPYLMPIENLEISLSDFGLKFPPIDVEPELTAETVAIEFALPSKIRVEQDDSILINIMTRFTAGDQQRSHPSKLTIKVRRIFKTELDEDFGALFK